MPRVSEARNHGCQYTPFHFYSTSAERLFYVIREERALVFILEKTITGFTQSIILSKEAISDYGGTNSDKDNKKALIGLIHAFSLHQADTLNHFVLRLVTSAFAFTGSVKVHVLLQ